MKRRRVWAAEKRRWEMSMRSVNRAADRLAGKYGWSRKEARDAVLWGFHMKGFDSKSWPSYRDWVLRNASVERCVKLALKWGLPKS